MFGGDLWGFLDILHIPDFIWNCSSLEFSVKSLLDIYLRKSDKRTVSPNRFPLLRSGSLSSRQGTPNSSRPTTPNPSRPTTPNLSIVGRRVSVKQSLYIHQLSFWIPLHQIWILRNRVTSCSILQSRENLLQCDCMLRRRMVRRSIDTPAKVNVYSRLCLVAASRRRMTCYILTWMNIEG